MTASRRQGAIVFGLIVLVGVFYLATFREGHRWGDDFSLYILHAKNIVEGRPYAETGYVYNPGTGAIGPPTYPPLFPLLLAPVYAIYGLDLEAMKILVVFFFMASLGMIFLLFRRDLLFPHLVLLIAFLGLNHYFWNLKDDILSDIPFLAFLYLVFFLIRTVHGEDSTRAGAPGRLLPSVLVGLTLTLCYGTRSVGIVLLPCLLIHDLLRFKRHKLRAHTYSLIVLWDNGRSSAVYTWLFVIFNVLAIVGYLSKIRRRFEAHDVFAVVYPAVLVFLPPRATLRYLIPIMPLYVFYGLLGLRWLTARRPALESASLVLLALAITGTTVSKYSTAHFETLSRGVTSGESRALFAFIKRETEEDAVILFRKPRALALFTGRRAAYHKALNTDWTFRFLEKIGATYVIVSPKDQGPRKLEGFMGRNPEHFRRVFASKEYAAYRILSYEPGGHRRE
jgi:hypothetical protein